MPALTIIDDVAADRVSAIVRRRSKERFTDEFSFGPIVLAPKPNPMGRSTSKSTSYSTATRVTRTPVGRSASQTVSNLRLLQSGSPAC